MPTEVNEEMRNVIANATMPAGEAVDAGSATPSFVESINVRENYDAQTNAVAPTSAEAEATTSAADPANPQDGSLTPADAAVLEAKPHEPIAPNWFQHIEVEGAACIRSIYDFGNRKGAEVVEFIKGKRHRVTPIEFKGVEINNVDYVGESRTHATPELAQEHLAELKGAAQ